MAETTTETAAERINRVAGELGLAMTAEFVPWSLSRNAGEKRPSLNWKVTIFRGHWRVEGGMAILTTDYMAGCGHCPASKASIDRYGDAIKPGLADVLSSLCSDAEAIDHRSFEDWAEVYGYDPDSRAAEATYKAYLDTALRLRNGIGETGLAALREACQDY